jgi:anti-sigma B factor antagonist
MASAPELEAGLLALADADVIVDLAGLTFIDSSGISVLILAFKRAAAHGRTFVLRAPPAQVARVLQMTDTDQMFTIEPPV